MIPRRATACTSNGCWPRLRPWTTRRKALTLLLSLSQKPPRLFDQAERWLKLYFSGGRPDFTPPLRPRGTAFQEAVWRRLLAIPYGCTAAYGEIAASLGLPPGAARAVGGAVGRNPISLIIPCHRVVGTNGNLTGYAGGIERKKRLLELEKG